MADLWIWLASVEKHQLSGHSTTLPCSLVFAGNFVARNKFPAKFFYSGCPHRLDTGHLCALSLEHTPKCDHGLHGTPFYRFQLVLYDAVHAGLAPIRAQLWESAAILLECSPLDFSLLSESEQTFRIHSLTQLGPKLKVFFNVNKYELHISHLAFVDARPEISIPPSVRTPIRTVKSPVAVESSTPDSPEPALPKSAKKFMRLLVDAFNKVDIK